MQPRHPKRTWLGSLLTRRLKLISALIIIFAAEFCAGCLAVGVINVCLVRRRSRAAGDKQARKQKQRPHGPIIFRLKDFLMAKRTLPPRVIAFPRGRYNLEGMACPQKRADFRFTHFAGARLFL
jgi:hypothetical protein